jgi:hypothetical protein
MRNILTSLGIGEEADENAFLVQRNAGSPSYGMRHDLVIQDSVAFPK